MSKAKFSTSSENFSSNGGFVWVSELLDSIPMMSLWDKLLPCRCNTRFSAQVMVRSAIGLMTAGSNNFGSSTFSMGINEAGGQVSRNERGLPF